MFEKCRTSYNVKLFFFVVEKRWHIVAGKKSNFFRLTQLSIPFCDSQKSYPQLSISCLISVHVYVFDIAERVAVLHIHEIFATGR